MVAVDGLLREINPEAGHAQSLRYKQEGGVSITIALAQQELRDRRAVPDALADGLYRQRVAPVSIGLHPRLGTVAIAAMSNPMSATIPARDR